MQDFEIEGLLLWLEIEVFRNLTLINSSTNLELQASDKYFDAAVLHAQYINYTFLAENSSLKLNVPANVIRGLDWQYTCTATSHTAPLKVDMFDELQERIFNQLSMFVFRKYLKSQNHAGFLSAVESDPAAYEAAYFPTGLHYVKFQ